MYASQNNSVQFLLYKWYKYLQTFNMNVFALRVTEEGWGRLLLIYKEKKINIILSLPVMETLNQSETGKKETEKKKISPNHGHKNAYDRPESFTTC